MLRRLLLRFDEGMGWTMRWGSIACFVALLVIIAANVFVRFVPVMSLGWMDEIVELAFAWMVFLGAAALWREGTHFRVDLLLNSLAGTRAGWGLTLVLNLLGLFFLVVFTYYGALLTADATDRSPILEYPRLIWYVVMPITGAIMIIYTLRDLWLLSCRASSP
ncbi:MAG TPA: TRAP transporter small permease subunit [Candidatus Methylomirabilis sp.]|nr:TRAP transporter small permease subunit [Candidatus Methylomirabilis sp.]HSD51050.1 TRAP transporter small permease subunit [Candidatus Methylomirabilis sp.]